MLLFGAGLLVSGMTDPANVLGFLDIFGEWRPQLALVMGAAVLTAAPSYWFARHNQRSLLGAPVDLPDRRRIDQPLLAGATMFGVGWGLSGICPGPGIVLLASGHGMAYLFMAAVIAGMWLVQFINDKGGSSMKRRWSVTVMLGLLFATASAIHAADALCPKPSAGQRPGEGGHERDPGPAEKCSLPDQRSSLERPFVRESAIRWSNLPVGITPRAGLRLGDLDEKQNHAARDVATAALSACGLKMLDDIRIADDVLKAVDERKIGWDAGNYFMSVLGTPSESKPWMLQIGGHHLAYNFTFNGSGAGATPLFFGS